MCVRFGSKVGQFGSKWDFFRSEFSTFWLARFVPFGANLKKKNISGVQSDLTPQEHSVVSDWHKLIQKYQFLIIVAQKKKDLGFVCFRLLFKSTPS